MGIVHRLLSGRRTLLPNVPRLRSLSRTQDCMRTCRNGWPGKSSIPTEVESQLGRHRRGSLAITNHIERIGHGCGHGARSRSRTGSA